MKIDYAYPLYEVREIKDLRDMLEQSNKLYGDLTAYYVKDERVRGGDVEFDKRGLPKRADAYIEVKFSQVYKDVRAAGTWIHSRAIQQPRIAILAGTRYEWYITYLATVNGSGIVIPLDKELPADEVQSCLERAEADVLVYAGDKADLVAEIRDDLPKLVRCVAMDEKKSREDDFYFWDILEQGRKMIDEGDTSYDELEIDPEEMRVLLFTSGTTAKAKAVMLSHKNICSNLMAMCSMIYIDENDTFLSVLPLHHTYECTCGFLCQLYRGSKVAVCDGLRYITQNMKEVGVTMILVVPLILEAFHGRIMKAAQADTMTNMKFNFGLKSTRFLRRLGFDLRRKIFKEIHENFGGKLRLIIAGGAAIEPQVMTDMQDIGFACLQGYGLTECAPILALNRDHKFNNRSAGLPMPGVDVKVINKDENGIGEICGKGPNVMIGYYGDPEKTAAAIDEDGYYHTGDLGYLDKDGFVILTGRKANLIVTKNGKNIFPEEIEQLLQQYELIKEVVIGPKALPSGDVEVHAFIFPNREKADETPELKDKALTSDEMREAMDEIIREVNHALVSYKHIKSFSLRDTEFEKTTSKKIRRNLIHD